MNEVWKKPPVTLDAYQAMVGKEVGVSSWHLIDQNRINVYADDWRVVPAGSGEVA